MADKRIQAVVGLDLSLTCSGVAVIDTQPIPGPNGVGTQLGSHMTAAIERLSGLGEPYMIMASRVLQAAVDEVDPRPRVPRAFPGVLWVIEGYAVVPGRGDGPALAGELAGLVKWLLFCDDQPYIAIPPSRIKKFAGGRGNAKKDEMRLAVFKAWGVEAKTTHEIDAFAAARLGATALGWFEPTNQPQREVVAEVRKQLRGLGVEVPEEPAEAKTRKGKANRVATEISACGHRCGICDDADCPERAAGGDEEPGGSGGAGLCYNCSTDGNCGGCPAR